MTTPNTELSGVASDGAPLTGTVSLKDSSVPAQERTASIDGNGSFSFDVSGLTPPYLLKAESTSGPMYSVSSGAGRVNINPLTNAAVAGAATVAPDELYASSDGEEKRRTSDRLESVIEQLRTVLAPLFDCYHTTNPITDDDSGLSAMLRDVRIVVANRTVTITNRQTTNVIFSGSLDNLAAGTFTPDNLPAQCTSGSPPPQACTSWTTGAWSACDASGTQTRTVTPAPAGCTGTPPGTAPTSSQSCTPAPVTCTSFTYSAWGACQSNSTQTRTVVSSSPAGCTGGSPILSQTCTYVPPACTYSYSAWSTCSAGGTQTRTVVSSAPAGCVGNPVLSQSCTPPPPPNPVTTANVVASCTGCHGLTSNTTVFKAGGYTVTGRSAANWLTTVNNMVGLGATLAPGTTAQDYANFLASVP